MVRDIGDTTVQLSWSRGFDNHSPIAKYTLQARTPPAGKWKQVRTSKCPALSGWTRPGCVPAVGAGGRGLGLSLELQRGTSLGHLPAENSRASGETVARGQQERGES